MSDDFEPYKPIACSLYSEYELAIIRRIKLRLGWTSLHGQKHIGYLLPLDLYTHQHVEYLAARAIDGKRHDIRLDKIVSSDVQEAITR
ncbi:MAG: transcriptional antiterminator, Rof [Gammaproteobacteria bacterium]|jgi:Rho-binding antiterminator